MGASQDKSQSHPRPDVTGLGPFWELPLSRPLSQSQMIKSVDSWTLQMRQEDLGASRLAADWPPRLGWLAVADPLILDSDRAWLGPLSRGAFPPRSQFSPSPCLPVGPGSSGSATMLTYGTCAQESGCR